MALGSELALNEFKYRGLSRAPVAVDPESVGGVRRKTKQQVGKVLSKSVSTEEVVNFFANGIVG